MITFYTLFIIIGVTTFLLLKEIGIGKRFLIAFLIVSILSITFTLLIVLVGDKPSPETRTVTLEELDGEGN